MEKEKLITKEELVSRLREIAKEILVIAMNVPLKQAEMLKDISERLNKSSDEIEE